MEARHEIQTPLGRMIMCGTDQVLTGLWFADGRICQKTDFPDRMLPVFAQTVRWLELYFQGKDPGFLPEISFETGTDFQKAVWEILRTIPYGEVRTYGEIAGLVAAERGMSRMSAQAVGQAVGRNPVSILVPCHRVIGKDGSLPGYGGGLDRKQSLLKLEGILP